MKLHVALCIQHLFKIYSILILSIATIYLQLVLAFTRQRWTNCQFYWWECRNAQWYF